MPEAVKNQRLKVTVTTIWILAMELVLLYGLGSGITKNDPYGIGMTLVVLPSICILPFVHLFIYRMVKKSGSEVGRLVAKSLLISFTLISSGLLLTIITLIIYENH